MLFRFMLAGALLALVAWVVRRALRPRPKVSAGERPEVAAEKTPTAALTHSELRLIDALARKAQLVDEALHLRPKILEIAKDERMALAVDNVMREVAREAENQLRIEDALAEIDDSRLGAQLSAADDQLRAAEDEDSKRLAEGTIERLMAVRDGRDKLRRRREEIETRTKHLVLELRSAHLAMLEAVSAPGASADRLEEVRSRLKQACDDAQRTAVAEEEVARLIARSGAVRER